MSAVSAPALVTDGPALRNSPGLRPDPPLRPHLPSQPPGPLPWDALIISDIHLGSDNCEAKPLAALLESILDGQLPTARLIINGDVFDSIDFRRLRKTHWKVLSLIRHLSDKIDMVWIAGNHDGSAEIVSHLLGVQVAEEYILVSGPRRFLILHGHQFDDFIDDHRFLTWVADQVYWFLQKLDDTHHIARLAKRRSKTFLHCVEKIQRGALARARHRACHAVICGHTHQTLACESTPIAYYNSGCWTERPSTLLTIAQGAVRIHLSTHLPYLAATPASLPETAPAS